MKSFCQILQIWLQLKKKKFANLPGKEIVPFFKYLRPLLFLFQPPTSGFGTVGLK
jgi:hypothetical protein